MVRFLARTTRSVIPHVKSKSEKRRVPRVRHVKRTRLGSSEILRTVRSSFRVSRLRRIGNINRILSTIHRAERGGVDVPWFRVIAKYSTLILPERNAEVSRYRARQVRDHATTLPFSALEFKFRVEILSPATRRSSLTDRIWPWWPIDSAYAIYSAVLRQNSRIGSDRQSR